MQCEVPSTSKILIVEPHLLVSESDARSDKHLLARKIELVVVVHPMERSRYTTGHSVSIDVDV